MIVVTGSAGFIGSCMVQKLNAQGYNDLILVDQFEYSEKNKNLVGKRFSTQIERAVFFDWVKQNNPSIEAVYHIGARTDTTEFNKSIFDELNVAYSQKIWDLCTEKKIPLLYASSAATYGMGEFGYSDSHQIVHRLKPLNPYGESKNDFDKWVLTQKTTPPFWSGVKFFNVYGPNEYHKNRMASVVMHGFNQIKASGKMTLFRSHKEEYADGMQLRDFVYVKDVVEACVFLMTQKPENGLYNIGTGQAESFYELAVSTFTALGKNPQIEFIDTPIDIRDKYQYFTQADISKLRRAGFNHAFNPLREGINDYVKAYLLEQHYL